MATLKLKNPTKRNAARRDDSRAPVRGAGTGLRRRPTLAEAQRDRTQRREAEERLQTSPAGRSPTGSPARSQDRETKRSTSRDAPTAPARRVEIPKPLPQERGTSTAMPQRGVSTSLPERGRVAPQAAEAPRQSRAQPFGQARPAAPMGRDRPDAAHRMAYREDAEPAPAERGSRVAIPKPLATPRPRAEHTGDRAPERPKRPQVASVLPERRGIEPAQDLPVARSRYRPPRETAAPELPDESHTVRLSKRMSQLGLSSRREADEWITKGWVRVDGRVVNELGSRVLPDQQITIDARAEHQQARRATVLINKPIGYVSGQAEDGYEPAVVLVRPDTQWRLDQSGTRFLREHLKSLVPAGRLDIDSVGLLVLTQDGRIAKQLIGEHSEVDKEYLVRVAGPNGEAPASAALTDEGLELLRHGLELDGEALLPALVEWQNDDQLCFVLREGKKRQIRRMCEAVGLTVTGLKRVRIGRVMLGDLPVGQWRYLRGDESFE
jgi:23S rRNA pseudouridine2604 synthase